MFVFFLYIYIFSPRPTSAVRARTDPGNYCDRPKTGRSLYCLLVPTPHSRRKGAHFAGKRRVYSISESRRTHNPLSLKTIPFFCFFRRFAVPSDFKKKKKGRCFLFRLTSLTSCTRLLCVRFSFFFNYI